MAIRIKRSSGDTAPALLESGQLAYVEGATNGGTLYYGEIGGTVRAIAGKKYIDKLDGIEAGAQVNTVTSVAGKTGAVTLAVGDVTNAESTANKGAANGYAPLDGSAKISSTYLPSYVDDVLEYADLAAFPGTGETGKIYVAQDTNKVYRWSGSAYIEISASPGSTDAVAEGSTNLYFTQARARQSVSVTDSGGDGSLSYDNSTGVFTYTGPSASEVRAHFSAGTGISITNGVITNTVTDTNTTYSISAETATGGAYVRLTDSAAGTDDVAIVGSGSVTVTRTDANTITVSGTDTGITDVVEDTSPQLGGSLDVNGYPITSTGGITLTPATGETIDLQGNLVVGEFNTNTTITTDGTSDLILNTNFGVNSGSITIADGANSNITITPNGTGKIILDGLNWPTADGTANYVLKTDGAGQLSWVAQTAGVTAFTGLSDVPASYSGAGGYYVKVNSGATALEFSQHVDDGTF